MPRGDRTGPMGMGPASGRGAGFCAGYDMPGYANGLRPGLGLGRARGNWANGSAGGRGWRNRFYATGVPGRFYFGANTVPSTMATPEMEKEFLKNRIQSLQAELEAVNKRLGELG